MLSPTLTNLLSFRIRNRNGFSVTLTNYGATLTGIWTPDRYHHTANVVLHYPTLAEYLTDPFYMGSTVGRFANRIADGRFRIDGRTYELSINEVALNNHIHGGVAGLSRQVWDVLPTEADSAIGLAIVSPHMADGYPGTVRVEAWFRVTEQNELVITYEATTDQPTILNLTDHSHFNLRGDGQPCHDHELTVYAAHYTPLNERYLPTGIVPVINTPYDWRGGLPMSTCSAVADTTNFCLKPWGNVPALAAMLYDPGSGRRMRLYTTAPGLQYYNAQYLSAPFQPYAAVCLEPQQYPDAPNHPEFPSALVMPDQPFRQTSVYQFDAV
jgi:aldose 1-epimerase